MPQIVYAVYWVEVEFGQRSEGYALFLDKKDCIERTKKSSRNGCYESCPGYLGPVRPLFYTEVPFDYLEEEYQKLLKKNSRCHTENNREPKFTGETVYFR